MKIRNTAIEDLPRVMEIFDIARNFMRKSGNTTQWNDNYPSAEMILSDIRSNVSYVIMDNDVIIGTFVFATGEEPSYSKIEGAWLNDLPYGTIHRIASDGSAKGIADECLKFCKSISDNIRIDTHKDNLPMLNWIRRSGFQECGVIYVSDGTPRHAFQLVSDVDDETIR